MNKIEFKRVTGEGVDALYDLYIDGKPVKSGITLDEVIGEISKKYERTETCNDG